MKIYSYEKSVHTEYTADNADFDLYCDVLCVGMGSAGVYAAIGAARSGVKVIALERDENVGGMSVNGRVAGYYYGLSGGAFEEVDARIKEDIDIFKAQPYFYDSRQVHIVELLKKHNITLLTASVVTGLFVEGDTVIGARLSCQGKKVCIKAKQIIDSTSDGHLINMCGVKTVCGRDTDKKTAPFTVRTEYFNSSDSHVSINSDSGYCNQYEPWEFSEKIKNAHADTVKYIKEDNRFLGPAPISGVREGLRFEGEDSLSYKDIIMNKSPEKVLFYAYSDIDKHGYDLAADEELYQNWWVISNLATVTVKIPVPLGCVVPRNIKGLVSAGRCMSADSYAMATVRMNRDMYRMGECVGEACALAVKQNTDFLNVDYDAYVKEVKKAGCFDDGSPRKFGFHFPGENKPYTPVDFNMTEVKILESLKTQTPGSAIWACFISDKSIAGLLEQEMNKATSKLYKYNCAIALGIMNESSCIDVLCDIVKNRDCFYFKDCRRSNQLRSAIAICLLGRLGGKEHLPLLEEIVFDKEEYKKELYHTLKPDYLYSVSENFNFVYFQLFTHAIMAVIKIYKRTQMDISCLRERMENLFKDGQIIKNVTSLGQTASEYAEIADFLDYALSLV